MKYSNDLSEFSASYYQKADVYKIFSDAEDREGLIWEILKNKFKDKKVLDLGCGNGRYLQLINEVASECVGVDQSYQQIKQSKYKLPFIVADGTNLPFSNNKFDYIISCWVWGTILDEEKRALILKEVKRVIQLGGSIFLIENDINSEFEFYRGRHLNNKTQEYNDWLLSCGFKIFQELEINISFDNLEIAQSVFKEIWKERLYELPKDKKIKNKVIVFELKIGNIV